MRVAFFGYDFFVDALRAFLLCGHELKHVQSVEVDGRYNSNTLVHALADTTGASWGVGPIDDGVVSRLREQEVDVGIVAAFEHKIPVLHLEGVRIVNIHPSLLPAGRGPWPLPWVILKGFTRTGVTIHRTTEAWDAGEVLLQTAFDVSTVENLESLSGKCRILASKMSVELGKNFNRLWNEAQPQRGDASYWKKPTWQDRTINWNASVNDIDRLVRAFGKFDTLAVFDNKEWIVQDISVWCESHKHEPGSVIARSNREYVVAASDGYVCVRFFEPDPDALDGIGEKL